MISKKMSQDSVYLAYITLPAASDPVELAYKFVDSGLCAGMNILGPGQSVYFWQGKTRKAEEWIIFAQVSKENMAAFTEALAESHPYIVPCIMGFSPTAGYSPFLAWIQDPAQSGGE